FDFNINPNLYLTGAVGPGTTPRSVFKFTNTNGTITPNLTPIFSESPTQDFRPFWVAVRPDTGQIYVSGFHTTTNADDIFVLTPTPGNPSVFTGTSAFATGAHFATTTGRLHGAIAFSKTGTLFVGSTDTLGQNGSIEVLNPVAGTNTYSSGTTITTANLGDIREIAVANDGTLLVTDSADPTNTNGAIFHLNPNGTVINTCSNPGAGGFVNSPAGIGALVTNSCSTTVNALPANVTSNCTAAGGLPASSATLSSFFSGVN